MTGPARTRVGAWLRRGLLAATVGLFAALPLADPGLAQQQEAPRQEVQPPLSPARPQIGVGNVQDAGPAAPAAQAAAELDYSAWEQVAERAESALENPGSTAVALDLLRAQLADWREALLVAQSTNSARIATLRQQIASLGAAPAEGQTEAEEIATRRAELNEQLVRLQAPGIAAVEAHSRADGLISEIDRTLRERQADELLRLFPSPVNPANWPDGFRAVTKTLTGLVHEVESRWALPSQRTALIGNLPAILLLLVIAAALISFGRGVVEQLVRRITERWSARGVRIAAFGLSLGQIVLPTAGVVALSKALSLTGMAGIVGTVLIDTLPPVAFIVFAAHWLGGRIFPRDHDFLPVRLSPERRAEGRLLTTLFGAVRGAEVLMASVMDVQTQSDAERSVLAFPTLVLAAFILLRFGQLLRQAAKADADADDDHAFRSGLLAFLGRAAMLIGLVGPLLAVIGYIPAASALVYPAATSLGVMGLLYILQMLVVDIYVAITGNAEAARKALVPVLIGFGLVFVALPVFALIWGARVADLTELWARMREGFQLGETRISPSNFLIFVILFAAGFTATRLFQGALKGSILPRTRLDQGARNALIAGVGYIGIFLAGLIAINAAGIDLSGLAIVAGALSVGIGFGLQNIVSNFVSGVILLIERPISEGDWIEVGGVQGTVKSISVRSTRIQTFDRNDVIVPNTDLVAGRVTNWTRFNLSGRLVVPIGVAYGADTRKVTRILQEIAEAQPLAILNPPPVVAFMGFLPDAMSFEIRIILRDVNFSLSVRSEINHQIARRFAEEGIDISYAQATGIALRNAAEIADLLRSRPGEAGSISAVPPGQAPGQEGTS